MLQDMQALPQKIELGVQLLFLPGLQVISLSQGVIKVAAGQLGRVGVLGMT